MIAGEGEAVHVAAGGEIASHALVGANLVEANAVVAAVNAEVEVAIGVAQQVARTADLVAPGRVFLERVVGGKVAKPDCKFAFIFEVAILVGVLEVCESSGPFLGIDGVVTGAGLGNHE